jgi:hypothetical protein
MVDRLKLLAFGAALVGLIPFCLLEVVEARCRRFLLETDDSAYHLPSAEWLVPLSLGYREALSGLIWTRVVVYFGEEHERQGQAEHLGRYLTAVTTLDPHFRRAYLWGSMAAIYAGTSIDLAGVRLSIEMLERGLVYFPDDGEFYYQLGFQRSFELRPFLAPDEAERVQRQAADDFCTAALLGGGPSFLPMVCANVARNAGLEELGEERLLQSLVSVEDENIRRRILERMTHSSSGGASRRAGMLLARWREDWLEQMPYAPPGFFALAGQWPLVPFADQLFLPLPGQTGLATESLEDSTAVGRAPISGAVPGVN